MLASSHAAPGEIQRDSDGIVREIRGEAVGRMRTWSAKGNPFDRELGLAEPARLDEAQPALAQPFSVELGCHQAEAGEKAGKT